MVLIEVKQYLPSGYFYSDIINKYVDKINIPIYSYSSDVIIDCKKIINKIEKEGG